jgi:putative exporter of polyketide antibiotics
VGSDTKDANRERLEVMKYAIILGVLSVFSLLMANEAGHSASDVLVNQDLYQGIAGVATYEQYSLLSISFSVAGVVCAVVAATLVIQNTKSR